MIQNCSPELKMWWTKKRSETEFGQLQQKASSLVSDEEFEAALPLAKQIAKEVKLRHGSNSLEYAAALKNLAWLLEQVGDGRGEQFLYQVLQIRRNVAGENHFLVAETLHELATFQESRKDNLLAETLLAQAIKIYKQTLPPDDERITRACLAMSRLRPHSLSPKVPAIDSPGEFTLINQQVLQQPSLIFNIPFDVMHRLTDCETLRLHGRYDEALLIVEEAVLLSRSLVGVGRAALVSSLNGLAAVLTDFGLSSLAVPPLIEASELVAELSGDDDPFHALILMNLGCAYRECKDYSNSASALAKARTILQPKYKQASDLGHIYAHVLEQTSRLTFESGDLPKARLIMIEAADIARQSIGETHPYFAKFLNSLAMLDVEATDFESARNRLQRACDIVEGAFGDKSPKYLEYRQSLTSVIYDITVAKSDTRPFLRRLHAGPLGNNHHRAMQRLRDCIDTCLSSMRADDAHEEYIDSLPQKHVLKLQVEDVSMDDPCGTETTELVEKTRLIDASLSSCTNSHRVQRRTEIAQALPVTAFPQFSERDTIGAAVTNISVEEAQSLLTEQ